MILLPEIATKLEKILNDQFLINNNPTPYLFRVETVGFHIDHLYNMQEGKNFIPVFIDTLGGQYNPVRQLKQAAASIPITFYFPVRFKDDFYVLADFLADVFVGNNINFGAVTGSAIANLSLPQTGEIQKLDFTEFKKWVDETYKMPIEVMEPYMTMQIVLYLSTASSEFLFGNVVSTSLTLLGDTDEENLTDNDVAFVTNNVQSNSQPSAEQELGTSEGAGIPTSTSYGAGFSVYIKKNAFYKKLIQSWFEGNSSDLVFELEIKLEVGMIDETDNTEDGYWTFTKKCYLQSANLVATKGQLITFTFAFGKLLEITDDEEE